MKIETGIIVMWIVGILATLAFWGGVAVVAWHFLARYW